MANRGSPEGGVRWGAGSPTVVIGFLVLVTIVGYLLSKMASEGIESYFLGGNKIPWWLLGISTATSNFDMSGTMIIVAVVFGLGYKGFLVEIRGGVGMSLAFILVFLAKWLRRSRVMTSAEWMKLRFGTDTQGKTAQREHDVRDRRQHVGRLALRVGPEAELPRDPGSSSKTSSRSAS